LFEAERGVERVVNRDRTVKRERGSKRKRGGEKRERSVRVV